MAMRIESGAEPIPGYRLIERLGGGGFGEVWKAEVPGGLFKAMKFVFGDLQGIDEDGSRAEQELKALSRVKTVHHPYILSLERYDIINGQLIIVMELADRTLWDRFRECRLQGLPGIPRDELLNYVQETAEALDLMNNQFQLQHLDIKPQNLFLVFNHVKVADFGLVKDLGNMAAATITGGVTPVYAAPETFDGWLSRFSDQYSLAIVYQELLTGVRPFQGSTMRQLVMQHLQSPPDVDPLPVNDRPPILRALSKNPDERFATCLDLVQALRNGVAKAFPKAPTMPGEVREPAPTTPNPMAQNPLHPISAGEITWQARRGMIADVPQPAPEEGGPSNLLLSGLAQQTPSELPSRQNNSVSLPSSRLAIPTRPPKATLDRRVQTAAAAAAAAAVPERPPIDDTEHRGVLQPTLILGLGQLGIETMQAFRRILSTEFGHFDVVPHLRFLALDTDSETLKAAGNGDERTILRPAEMILAKLQRANHYLAKMRGETKWPTEEWLNGKLLYRIPRDNAKAPVRQLARFALANSLPGIARRIETELQAVVSDETVHEPSKITDLGTRTGVPRVVVIANLAGATGGGTFLDVAYLVRNQLRLMNLAHAEVVGLFYLPPTGRDGIRSAALANTYAALTELDYYQRRDGMSASFRSFDNKEMPRLDELGPPFHRCFFLDLPEVSGTEAPATPPVVDEAAQFLYRDLITPLGKTLDKLRQKRRPAAKKTALLRFGLHRRSWPRRELVRRLAEKFTLRLVDRWKSKNAQAFAAEIHPWTLQQWEAMEMRPENLIARHQDRLERTLGTAPDKQFQEILTPLVNLMHANKGSVSSTPFIAAMDRIEKVVGIPELCRDLSNRNTEPGTLERALKDISAEIGDQCDTRLAELIVALIEAPQFRLAGAEEAVRRFGTVVEDALKIQEGLAKELSERAAALYKRIQEVFEKLDKIDDKSSSGSTWFSRKTTTASKSGTDVFDLLRVYSKTQYQALLLSAINRLYIGVRGHLSDQLREIGFCRTRLEELAGLIRDRRTQGPSGPAKFEQFLLPTGTPTIDELVVSFEKKLTEEELVGFDESVQAHVRKQYRALLNVCLGPAAVVRALAPVMLAEAEIYLDERFPAPNIVDLLGETEGGLVGAVGEMFDEAAPEAKRLDPEKEVSIATIPGDDSGMVLATSFAKALPGATLLSSDRGEEIVIYREHAMTGLGELEQMGPVAQEAYRQKQAIDPTSLHSRDDISDWSSRPLEVGT